MYANYGETGNNIYSLCMNIDLDIHVLDNMLEKCDANFISSSDDDDYCSMLANLYEDFSMYNHIDEEQCGSFLLSVTKCFLKHGFDVKKYGCECLDALCWADAGSYTLEIAELLLDNGAGLYFEDEDERADDTDEWNDDSDYSVLSSIAGTLGRWETGLWENANLMTAYYMMVKRAEEGRDYHGIRAAETCIGLSVDKVEKISVSLDNKSFNEHQNQDYKDGLVLWCDGHPLILREYSELFVDPMIINDCVSSYDVSDQYAEIIGARISRIQFIGASYALISFDDRKQKILVARIMLSEKGNCHGVAALVSSIEINRVALSDIENIYLIDGTVYSHDVRVYEEEAIFLKGKESDILIYSEEIAQEQYTLKALKTDKTIMRGKYREMHCPNISFSKVLTADVAGVKELEFQCEDGFLYFKADAYTNVDILLSPKRLDKILSTFLYDNDYTEIKFFPVELK